MEISQAIMTEFNFKTKPFKHQLKEFELTKDHINWGLFWEMGTGKSWVLLNTAAWLYQNKKIDAVVYIAKKGEYLNFSKYELPLHFPDVVSHQALAFSSERWGSSSFKQEFAKLLSLEELPILSINVESLIFNGGEALAAFYKAYRRVMLIVDESTCVKSHDIKRSKEVYYWAAHSTHRRIATGTPYTKWPMDVYGQSLVLGKEILGFKSYYTFKHTYCVMVTDYGPGGRQFQRIAGFRNIDDLTRRIGYFASRVTKEQCLDLPEKIYERKVVALTPKQAAQYKQMREQAILELESGETITVTNVLAQFVKLHQILCGQMRIDDKHYASLETDRINVLIGLLEDHDGKAVIWAGYRQSIADVVVALKDKFGADSTVAYYGDVGYEDRIANLEAFKTGNAKYFVGNPASAGYGISLIEADLVIYYSNSFNLEYRLQSEDRTHRIGQHRPVVYIDLVCENTIDERIIDVLRAKKNIADLVMQKPLREWI